MFEAFRSWLGRRGARPVGNGGAVAGGTVGCQEALDRIYELLDGELDTLSHDEVEEHFRVCRRCYPHLAMERSFREAVQRALSSQGAPARVRDRVLEILSREEGG